MRQRGLKGFQISELGPDGVLVRASQREEYFPASGSFGDEPALGFDVASEARRREAIEKSRDSGETIVSAGVKIIGGKFGFLVFLPVYKGGMPTDTVEDRQKNLEGFVTWVFEFHEIVEEALAPLWPTGIDLLISDESAPAWERILYFHSSRTRVAPVKWGDESVVDYLEVLQHTERFEVSQRQWTILAIATPGFVASHTKLTPLYALAMGLTLTGLLAAYFLTSIHRRSITIELNEQLNWRITEQKQTEAFLRQIQQSLTEAQRISNFGSWEQSLQTGESVWSNECYRIMGVQPQEVKADYQILLSCIHPEDRKLLKVAITETIAKGVPYDNQVRVIRPSGEERVVHSQVEVHRDKAGNPIRLIGTFHDITERRRAEKEIHKLNEELEQRVIDRTTQLKVANKKLEEEITERKRAEEKLQRDQKQLKALVSALSRAEEAERRRIATELHEEISQTLALSKIKCQTLQERLPSSEDFALAGEIGELVAEVINHTRTLTYELSPTVLYEVGLEAGIEWLAEQSQNKHGLVCQFQSDQKHKPLGQDTSLVLFQSVRELLANAVHHGHASHAKITSRREDSQIGILVDDDGMGFDSARTQFLPSAKGGFGLFNIRERVEALGGSFEIASKQNGGTQVHLLVPLERGKG